MPPLPSRFPQQLYEISFSSSHLFKMLTIACIQVERALNFWRDGYITLESIADDKSGKSGTRKTVNEYTGKGTKTTEFNHANWRVATNAYLTSINANLLNGKLVWKEVIRAARAFAKLNGSGDSATTLGGDVEDERALLVADSDSESDADL
jgi:hypothetical protein